MGGVAVRALQRHIERALFAVAVLTLVAATSPSPTSAVGFAVAPAALAPSPRFLLTTPPPRRSVVRLSQPVRVIIPAVGVDAGLVRLGLNRDGTLQVPSDYAMAGWWTGGAVPGAVGPAVIVGHIDNTSGPAVFYRIRELKLGNRVLIRLKNGSMVRFVVQEVAEFPKSRFPSRRVYGAVPYPALRLITCGGSFDFATGHYLDNIVVFATLE